MYELIDEGCVCRLTDNMFLPFDDRNTDYQRHEGVVSGRKHAGTGKYTRGIESCLSPKCSCHGPHSYS